MKYKLVIKEEAADEISEAFTWYEDQKMGLGSALIDVLEDYLDLIQTNPQLYQIRSGTERAAVIRKFPYKIIYRIEGNTVVVFSVFHTSRKPKE